MRDTRDKDIEVALKQYDRFAADLRFQHTLIRQIPSAALIVITGIVILSFSQLHEWARVTSLASGALLQFGLMIAVAKHRFTADAKSQFLKGLEHRVRAKQFPITTEETKEYFKGKGKKLTKDPLFRFLKTC